jgi:transcriptional regulator with XRE-family HTH domain
MAELRKQFAKRLKQAMQAAGFESKPSVLVNQFNLEHRGSTVTFQSASSWLKGESLPDPEKIQTIARVFGVSACHLLFGEQGKFGVRDAAQEPVESLRAQDHKMLSLYLQLSTDQRKLVRDLVDEVANGKQPAA